MSHLTFRTPSATAFALTVLAASSACGPKPEAAATATPPPAAAAMPAETGTDLQPGLWRMTFAMTDIEAPGAPPEVAAALKGMTQTSSETSESCMTVADSKDGLSKIVGEMRQGESCTTKDYSNANGRVVANIECGKGGETGTIAMTGTYSATTMDLTIKGAMPSGSGVANASVTMTLKGERIGDCPG
ncbi:MAG: DUF3617 domain-containing protein [Hyphomonadaceae bacterium]|jgi:hypothetical protein|nr:DUF3617 domain-containing protein [Hyphomonadaceae bacterium]